MKKVRKTITANANTQEPSELSTEARYSTADLYMILLSMIELLGQQISFTEKEDGSCDVNIDSIAFTFYPH